MRVPGSVDLEVQGPSLASLLALDPPGSDYPVGARLTHFSHRWVGLLGPCRASEVVSNGVLLDFWRRPQLSQRPVLFPTRNREEDLQAAVDALLRKSAVEKVKNPTTLGFYSRLFLVPKASGDLRPVIDLSTLNRHLVIPHFKMETQHSVRSAIRQDEWSVSVDLRDASLHVLLVRVTRKYPWV